MILKPRQRFQLSASVFVVINRGHEVLLLRRSATGWMDGKLSLPAGAVDGNEGFAEAAARELFEETGLVVQIDDLTLGHVQHNITVGAEWVGFYFIASRWSGIPRIAEPSKHSELVWSSLDVMPDDLIDYVSEALRQIQRGVPLSPLRVWGSNE